MQQKMKWEVVIKVCPFSTSLFFCLSFFFLSFFFLFLQRPFHQTRWKSEKVKYQPKISEQRDSENMALKILSRKPLNYWSTVDFISTTSCFGCFDSFQWCDENCDNCSSNVDCTQEEVIVINGKQSFDCVGTQENLQNLHASTKTRFLDN